MIKNVKGLSVKLMWLLETLFRSLQQNVKEWADGSPDGKWISAAIVSFVLPPPPLAHNCRCEEVYSSINITYTVQSNKPAKNLTFYFCDTVY